MKTRVVWEWERKKLVDSLISKGYLSDEKVKGAMLSVPRHEFIPQEMRMHAYRDTPLTIGSGQTISAPHMVAIMTGELGARIDSRILEVGAGSGYQAAVLAEIATEGEVVTLERIKELADYARMNLERLGYANVEVIHAEGTQGYREKAPYDLIIVTAAAPRIPKALIEQLKEGGRMLIPVGGKLMQTLMLVEKKKGVVVKKEICGCVFVPLIGEDGW
ncbi:MAG: protein-L-isoaspartate O-methyltransferase [Candidatus Altiarchaeales archaeon ex4484_2]|nr:MAG: protein-L-isoaspartate O-methyltransferase [Candidatus Altiarchaeales archaeon ex4484_2]